MSKETNTVVGKPITLKDLIELIKKAEEAKKEGLDPVKSTLEHHLKQGPYSEEELNEKRPLSRVNAQFESFQYQEQNANTKTKDQ